jgi:ribonuclease HII
MKQNQFELDAWASSNYVCGIDEVGRGSLLGPVVVAAAILPLHTNVSFLKDSKKMTERERERAFEWIIEHAWTTVSFGSQEMVDHYNIYRATQRTMYAAWIQMVERYSSLVKKLKYLLIDAMPLSLGVHYLRNEVSVLHFPHGEDRSISIAAASIVAKVTRDRFIKRLAKDFPQYSFEGHKGYATKAHIGAVRCHGASVVHRMTFLTKILAESVKHEHEEVQSSLF